MPKVVRHTSKDRPWLLAMDLDGALWDHLDISSVDPPYTPIGPGRIMGRDGTIVTLFPEAVEFIVWCRSNGAITCTLSWNHTHYAMEALEKLGIIYLFDYHETEFSPAKDQRLLHLLETLRRNHIVIPPERVVYVDDRDIHIEDIRRNVGNILFIHIWKDVKNYTVARSIIKKSVLGGEA
ncbi:MAG: magnesium-dependent phosphatase-1 [Thermoprotei archaeon]